MPDTQLYLMSLCIFVPTICALVLLFFPKGANEAMRWWSLFGTCVAFVFSLMLFIDYQAYLSKNQSQLDKTSLVSRGEELSARAASDDNKSGTNLLGKVPWIPRFNIEY